MNPHIAAEAEMVIVGWIVSTYLALGALFCWRVEKSPGFGAVAAVCFSPFVGLWAAASEPFSLALFVPLALVFVVCFVAWLRTELRRS